MHECIDLISSLLSLSTVHLPLRTLLTAQNQLSIYLSKFKHRLSTQNSLHLKRLISLFDALAKYTEEWKTQQSTNNSSQPTKKTHDEVLTSGELLRKLGRKVEGINLLEIESYLKKSKIARKISGYCVKELEKAAGAGIFMLR